MKMLSKRLRGINTKIKETKDSLEKLESEKALIKTLFAKEKEKMKTGLEMSRDTSFSKCFRRSKAHVPRRTHQP